MKVYLTFYKKSSQFLGVSSPLELEIEEIPSGCPVIVVVDHDFIKCVYRVGTNGEINQIYGYQDYLIQIDEIIDLSYKFLKIYHYIRFVLENLFRELLLEELAKNKTSLLLMEKSINDNYFNNSLNWDVFKSIVSKEIRSSKIENKLKTKLSNKLNKLREPTAYVTSKKIDVNMMGYDIKFIKP
jgi:hypothetical protein